MFKYLQNTIHCHLFTPVQITYMENWFESHCHPQSKAIKQKNRASMAGDCVGKTLQIISTYSVISSNWNAVISIVRTKTDFILMLYIEELYQVGFRQGETFIIDIR